MWKEDTDGLPSTLEITSVPVTSPAAMTAWAQPISESGCWVVTLAQPDGDWVPSRVYWRLMFLNSSGPRNTSGIVSLNSPSWRPLALSAWTTTSALALSTNGRFVMSRGGVGTEFLLGVRGNPRDVAGWL